VQINIAISKPAAGIVQQAYVLYDAQKEPLLRQILQSDDYQSIIVFSSTKDNVKLLERSLRSFDRSVKAFHSDLEQAEREEIMREFKSKRLHILIGTDILSRGIDVDGISLVVNYDAPGDPEDYIHRIGRTARASKAGVAITFINQKDQGKFSRIEDLMGMEVPKLPLPAELGEGPKYDPDANKRSMFKPGGGKRPGGGKSNFKGKRRSGPGSPRHSGHSKKH
jgi:superfamily II DNA/RNA helicase